MYFRYRFPFHSPNGTRDRMMRDARAALEALPLSTAGADLDAAAERVIAPFRATDQQFEAAERKQRDVAAAEHRAEIRWILHLSNQIDTRLGQLEQKKRVMFDGFSDRREMSRSLEQKIKPIIVGEIINDQGLSDARLKARIAALVDRHYEEFCE